VRNELSETYPLGKKFKNPAKFDNKFYENADHFVITLPLYLIFYNVARKKMANF